MAKIWIGHTRCERKVACFTLIGFPEAERAFFSVVNIRNKIISFNISRTDLLCSLDMGSSLRI